MHKLTNTHVLVRLQQAAPGQYNGVCVENGDHWRCEAAKDIVYSGHVFWIAHVNVRTGSVKLA